MRGGSRADICLTMNWLEHDSRVCVCGDFKEAAEALYKPRTRGIFVRNERTIALYNQMLAIGQTMSGDFMDLDKDGVLNDHLIEGRPIESADHLRQMQTSGMFTRLWKPDTNFEGFYKAYLLYLVFKDMTAPLFEPGSYKRAVIRLDHKPSGPFHRDTRDEVTILFSTMPSTEIIAESSVTMAKWSRSAIEALPVRGRYLRDGQYAESPLADKIYAPEAGTVFIMTGIVSNLNPMDPEPEGDWIVHRAPDMPENMVGKRPLFGLCGRKPVR